ncbi:hypothetical protein I0C86_41575 [Plantactinospora sp. S1510]|uniref:Uncharacterized protein n=1 Tax=Plantactinospora alkalitolerans TaxID=2789879 RepID=A0ABS0HAH0_9ACTN|nr:hypothetical protein [Plantactinospora alkalitolerans]MBF9135344.1 hypothetical protein [Plantactinospora alkalitolerans]
MTRVEASRDARNYVRISNDIWHNKKLKRIKSHAARWAYVVSIAYCGSTMSDGHFPVDVVVAVAEVPQSVVAALVKQKLWHLPEHECGQCEQPESGDAVVHDYLKHQRSREDVQDLTAKRRAAGAAGAAARWGNASENAQPGMASVKAGRNGTAMPRKKRKKEEPPPPSPTSDAAGIPVGEEEDSGAKILDDAVVEVLKDRPDWDAEELRQALADPKVRRRPPDVVAQVLLKLAADPGTERPGRIRAKHPYWQQVEREIGRRSARRDATLPGKPHPWPSPTAVECNGCTLPRQHAIHDVRPPGANPPIRSAATCRDTP